MLEALMNPGSMTQAQWLVLGLLLIMVIGVLFFVYRIYLIIRDSGKNKYKPNIGLHKTAGQAPADDTSESSEPERPGN